MMKCVILEDNLMARQLLEQMINETESIELIESFSSSVNCFQFLTSHKIDLLFLDIEVPEMSGLEMVANLAMQPLIIFTTGYKEYALSSFEHNVVDFLVKPFNYARFIKAVMKAKKLSNKPVQQKTGIDENYLFIKHSGQFIKLSFTEVKYIEALGDYITIHTEEKKYTLHETMKNFIIRLPGNFLRIHRSFVINTSLITSIEDNTIYIQAESFPIGVSYREAVYKNLKLT